MPEDIVGDAKGLEYGGISLDHLKRRSLGMTINVSTCSWNSDSGQGGVHAPPASKENGFVTTPTVRAPTF